MYDRKLPMLLFSFCFFLELKKGSKMERAGWQSFVLEREGRRSSGRKVWIRTCEPVWSNWWWCRLPIPKYFMWDHHPPHPHTHTDALTVSLLRITQISSTSLHWGVKGVGFVLIFFLQLNLSLSLRSNPPVRFDPWIFCNILAQFQLKISPRLY